MRKSQYLPYSGDETVVPKSITVYSYYIFMFGEMSIVHVGLTGKLLLLFSANWNFSVFKFTCGLPITAANNTYSVAGVLSS